MKDEIDTLLDEYSVIDGRLYHHEDREAFKQAILALKKKWLIEAILEEAKFIQYNLDREDVMTDWLQDRINQLNGDK